MILLGNVKKRNDLLLPDKVTERVTEQEKILLELLRINLECIYEKNQERRILLK